MNYRHGYHAGNFADVFKHTILIGLIEALKRKEKPFCFIDIHAGRGIYDLQHEFSKKTQEYIDGVAKIMNIMNTMNGEAKILPLIIKTYQEIVSQFYPLHYPGSPLIAEHMLREFDRLVLTEYHPEEYAILKDTFKKFNAFKNDQKYNEKDNQNFKQIEIHHQDGYLNLKAFLPPKERRGLILIDPPFEQPLEWAKILAAVQIGLQKFPTGIYAIWYPIKDPIIVKNFLKSLKDLNVKSVKDIMIVELNIYPVDAALKLLGCGMLIINPPWQFESELKSLLPILWETFSYKGAGGYSIRSL